MESVEATVRPLTRGTDWAASPPAPPVPIWKHAVSMVLALATIVLIVAVTARIVPAIAGRPPRHIPVVALVRQFMLLMLLFPPVVLVHELGHAIAGTLGGWRLQSLFIGPWRFVRDGKGARLVWHRSFFFYGGAAALAPREWGSDERIRRTFRRMVGGGPLASLLLAIVLFAVLYLTRTPGQSVLAAGWRFFVFVAAALTVAIGLGTLIPIRQSATIRNDGLQLVLARPRDRDGKPRPLDPGIRHGALILLLTEWRPRDWTPEMLAMLAGSPADQRRLFEYYHALDSGDVALARDIVQSALDSVAAAPGAAGARVRQAVAVEAATFEAAWRGDIAAAREWLAIGEPSARWDEHAVWIARAAIHAASHESAEALDDLARAERSALRRIVARVDLLRAPFVERITALAS